MIRFYPYSIWCSLANASDFLMLATFIFFDPHGLFFYEEKAAEWGVHITTRYAEDMRSIMLRNLRVVCSGNLLWPFPNWRISSVGLAHWQRQRRQKAKDWLPISTMPIKCVALNLTALGLVVRVAKFKVSQGCVFARKHTLWTSKLFANYQHRCSNLICKCIG